MDLLIQQIVNGLTLGSIYCLVALLVGLISFRTRGHYFVILTLCIGVIINLVIERGDKKEFSHGLRIIPSP